MTYLSTFEGWQELSDLFIVNGFTLDFDLSNTPYYEQGTDEIEFPELPEVLQIALIQFAEKNNLNN